MPGGRDSARQKGKPIIYIFVEKMSGNSIFYKKVDFIQAGFVSGGIPCR